MALSFASSAQVPKSLLCYAQNAKLLPPVIRVEREMMRATATPNKGPFRDFPLGVDIDINVNVAPNPTTAQNKTPCRDDECG
jgi:hypothetical protein